MKLVPKDSSAQPFLPPVMHTPVLRGCLTACPHYYNF
jgi:hypothetical protein